MIQEAEGHDQREAERMTFLGICSARLRQSLFTNEGEEEGTCAGSTINCVLCFQF